MTGQLGVENLCILKHKRESFAILLGNVSKVNDMTNHSPPPIPPVEIESAVTPLTVAKEGKKRQLEEQSQEIKNKLCFFELKLLLQI